MSHRNQLLAIAIVTAVIIGATTAVTAHDWQNEVEQGEMVLGVSTSPGTPIAGLETEFSGSITDNAAEAGQANRTDWGGVTNKQLEVHINGPDVHDHVTTHVPAEDSHFHFAYAFPEAGTYTITVITTIDGDEYAFEFEREVGMLPARAEGETIDNIDENVSELTDQVNELSAQVESLQEDQESTSLSGIGLTVGVVGLLAGASAFVVARRT